MSTVAWHLEHSVDAEVSAALAWSFWTDIGNWDDPPARFELDGPFAVGSQGSTLIPGQEPLHWRIRNVRPGDLATIEMPLDRATLSFEWRFEALSEHRTRLTQRIALSGENSEAYVGQVQAGFGRTLREGMERVARLMEAAQQRSTRPVS